MRLPRIHVPGAAEAQVDKEKAIELIQYAADHGVTYFDSAYGYHNMTSESVLGEALDSGGRREKVRIATKQPFMVMKTQDDIRRNLENTLKKLRSDHIDMYLIHNLQKAYWEDVKKRKIFEEYEKFRSEGLIRGIGFSYHGDFPGFKEILSAYPWDMCQIQQNLLDVDHEATEEGIKLAGEKGCGLVIMEPLRGGNLAVPPPPIRAIYDEYPAERSGVEWAFKHVINYPQVSVILSGMTTLEQLRENIAIFSKPGAVPNSLSPEEKAILARVKERYESIASIPCTSCEYCQPCPQGVCIPDVFSRYNDGIRFGVFEGVRRNYSFLVRANQDASHCVECGECEAKCPQHIAIPRELKIAHEALKGWVE
jgi:predicted aldo/keto reductase-like oxidoreductase